MTLQSETTPYCMDASIISTAIRSKHKLERGTDLHVRKEKYQGQLEREDFSRTRQVETAIVEHGK